MVQYMLLFNRAGHIGEIRVLFSRFSCFAFFLSVNSQKSGAEQTEEHTSVLSYEGRPTKDRVGTMIY